MTESGVIVRRAPTYVQVCVLREVLDLLSEGTKGLQIGLVTGLSGGFDMVYLQGDFLFGMCSLLQCYRPHLGNLQQVGIFVDCYIAEVLSCT